MMHPPTVTDGPLESHELDELAELLADLDDASGDLGLPENLVLRISAFACRLSRLGATR